MPQHVGLPEWQRLYHREWVHRLQRQHRRVCPTLLHGTPRSDPAVPTSAARPDGNWSLRRARPWTSRESPAASCFETSGSQVPPRGPHPYSLAPERSRRSSVAGRRSRASSVVEANRASATACPGTLVAARAAATSATARIASRDSAISGATASRTCSAQRQAPVSAIRTARTRAWATSASPQTDARDAGRASPSAARGAARVWPGPPGHPRAADLAGRERPPPAARARVEGGRCFPEHGTQTDLSSRGAPQHGDR